MIRRRTRHRQHVYDAVVTNIDYHRNSARPSRANNDVGTNLDLRRVGGLINERPRQSGLVHRVEVDEQVDNLRHRYRADACTSGKWSRTGPGSISK